MLRIRDPVPCWTLDSGFGWVKNQDLQDPGWTVPDHISESLETIFWVKSTKILWCGSGIRNFFDPVSRIGMEKIRIHFSSYLSLLGSLIYLPSSRYPITPLSTFQPSCCLWHVSVFFRSSRAAGEEAESGDWRHGSCLGSRGSYLTTPVLSLTVHRGGGGGVVV